jgi:hypothetical protein
MAAALANIRRSRAEYEHGCRQRQHEQPDQRAAAAQADGQRRPDRGKRAQCRRCKQQREHQNRQRLGRKIERQRENRRDDYQRQAADDPMRASFREYEQAQRGRAQNELLHAAVIHIRTK